MADAIRAGFEKDCAHLKIDEELVKRIRLYKTGFINKNADYAEFFGGHLIGVKVVRFTDADEDRWFDEILRIDQSVVSQTHHRNPVLNGENGLFKVAGNPLNLASAWLLHKFHSNSKMSAALRQEAMIDLLIIMQATFLTSRLYRHFKYPADPEVAEAAYLALSNKFLIKTEGSWLGVLTARAKDVIAANSIHYNAISRMDEDRGVVYLINDTQGRIREMLKNIYDVFLKTHQSGIRVSSTSAVAEFDGVESIRDQIGGVEVYKRYLRSIVADKNSFIRSELVKVTLNLADTAKEKNLLAVLSYISENHLRSATDEIDDLLNETMIHSFRYLSANSSGLRSTVDLPAILTRLKGVYTSSRSTDPDLLALRKRCESVVKKSIQTTTPAVISATRTAVLLYLVARAYSMRYYTNAGDTARPLAVGARR